MVMILTDSIVDVEFWLDSYFVLEWEPRCSWSTVNWAESVLVLSLRSFLTPMSEYLWMGFLV